MFHVPKTQWKMLDGVVVQNILHKETVRTDKVSEIVKYLDSDGGSFSELTDSDMCKVNSPFQQQQQQ
jgi:spore germination protein YaaH